HTLVLPRDSHSFPTRRSSDLGHLAVNYVNDVQQRLNVEEWMKYMAINTLLDNNETCLANGVGDDYALYRGAIDTRFLALPYDLEDRKSTRLNSSHVKISYAVF